MNEIIKEEDWYRVIRDDNPTADIVCIKIKKQWFRIFELTDEIDIFKDLINFERKEKLMKLLEK